MGRAHLSGRLRYPRPVTLTHDGFAAQLNPVAKFSAIHRDSLPTTVELRGVRKRKRFFREQRDIGAIRRGRP